MASCPTLISDSQSNGAKGRGGSSKQKEGGSHNHAGA